MSLDCFGGFLNQIMTEKKVQLSGHWLQCLGGSMSLDCFGRFVAMFFGRFLDQITSYDRKKVQLSGHWLECLLHTFDSF
jgi:hypothetical protein